MVAYFSANLIDDILPKSPNFVKTTGWLQIVLYFRKGATGAFPPPSPVPGKSFYYKSPYVNFFKSAAKVVLIFRLKLF